MPRPRAFNNRRSTGKIRARQPAAPASVPATTATTTVADPVAAAGDKAEDAEG